MPGWQALSVKKCKPESRYDLMSFFSRQTNLAQERLGTTFEPIFGDREEGFVSGANATHDRSADLADPNSFAIGDRNLFDHQIRSRGLNLHLNGPPKIPITHLQVAK